MSWCCGPTRLAGRPRAAGGPSSATRARRREAQLARYREIEAGCCAAAPGCSRRWTPRLRHLAALLRGIGRQREYAAWCPWVADRLEGAAQEGHGGGGARRAPARPLRPERGAPALRILPEGQRGREGMTRSGYDQGEASGLVQGARVGRLSLRNRPRPGRGAGTLPASWWRTRSWGGPERRSEGHSAAYQIALPLPRAAGVARRARRRGG